MTNFPHPLFYRKKNGIQSTAFKAIILIILIPETLWCFPGLIIDVKIFFLS